MSEAEKVRQELRAALHVVAVEQRRAAAVQAALTTAMCALIASHPDQAAFSKQLNLQTADLLFDDQTMAQAVAQVLHIFRGQLR